jgi:ligand-binding sensor domain-containing protein
MKFLLLLALGWLYPQKDPLFQIHCSTRQVTCLSENAIGTSGGLRHPHSPKVDLPGTAVRAILGDLLAADTGLYDNGRCLDPEPTWSLAQTPQGLVSGHNGGKLKLAGREVHLPTDAPIHSLAWDGRSLLAASNQGLWSLEGETVREVRLSSNPVASTVTSLVVSKDLGGAVVGTAAGAFRRKGNDWAPLAGGVVNVSAIALDADQSVWVGTPDQGLYHEVRGVLQPVESTRGITSLLSTGQGLLVGTDHGAFLNQQPLYDYSQEISGNHITALACSKNDVWVGTFQDGLSHRTGPGWQPLHGLPSQWVNHLSTCGEEVLVRFSSGLVLSGQNGTWRTMGKRSGWPKDWTSALGPDWVATLSAFYARQGKGWQTFAPKPALQGVTITAVARYAGDYWLASQNGLYRYDGKQSRQFLQELPDNWITCLETYQGKLWAGTFAGGVAVYDGRAWRVELPNQRIHCLLSTAQGIWAGTPQGLLWNDGRGWRRFGRQQGLPGDVIWSLASRGDGLWIGTDSGLAQASLSRLTRTEVATARAANSGGTSASVSP